MSYIGRVTEVSDHATDPSMWFLTVTNELEVIRVRAKILSLSPDADKDYILGRTVKVKYIEGKFHHEVVVLPAELSTSSSSNSTPA